MSSVLVPLRPIFLVAAVSVAVFAARAQAQTAPPSDPVATDLGQLDPSSPMAPLPDLGVPWPDLGTPDAIEGELPPATAETTASEDGQRYSVAVEGISELGAEVSQRFELLSTLKKGDGKPANAAQINRRAREDEETLDTILRAAGYYDASVETVVTPGEGRLAVKLIVTPGARYAFSDVRLSGLEPTDGKADMFRDVFGVKAETPVDADIVVAGQIALRERLGREGFPFARVAESSVVVDHETQKATLDLAVDPGSERRFGAIRILGDRPPFGAKHTQVIARFKPGQLYDQYLVDDLRRALVATGLVSSVTIEPVAVGTDIVDMATTMEPAPVRTVAGELGYGTGEGFRIEASWQHRNLIRPEGAVTFRGVAGTREQLLGANLRMGNFRKRDVVLNAHVLASNDDRPAYDARTFEIGANLERQTNLIWQKKWTYSLGFDLLASNERDFGAPLGISRRLTYFIFALPGTLAYDGSDDLLNPTRGFRLSGRLSPEFSLQGNAFGYARAQVDGSIYRPFGKRLVLAARGRLGAIAGASRGEIAPSRLFYSGGGGSVRGFGYQQIGPRNALDRPIGGRSLTEFSLEARVRLPVFGGNFGVVPFLDGGNIYTSSYPKFSGLRLGAGVGLRYYSNFGPIRIDVGTPLARRPGESPIAIYVSLGQAF